MKKLYLTLAILFATLLSFNSQALAKDIEVLPTMNSKSVAQNPSTMQEAKQLVQKLFNVKG